MGAAPAVGVHRAWSQAGLIAVAQKPGRLEG